MGLVENTMLELHDGVLQELQAAGRLSIPVGGARPLIVVNRKITTEDIPTRSLVVDLQGRPFGVLFVSTPIDADYVARSLDTAAQVKCALGQILGSVILEPIAHGKFGGCSFALWPWHRTPTVVRGLAYLQRRRIMPRVLSWLREATQRTARVPQGDELNLMFREPLARMSSDERFPSPSQALAQDGLRRLESGEWRPFVALQHKDILWNILLPRDRAHRRQFPFGFILIDWVSGTLRGHPFFNLLELARTSRMSRAAVRQELLGHCRVLTCDPRDILSYALAAVGFRLAHLGRFPEDLYFALYQHHLRSWLDAVRGVGPLTGQL